MHIQDNKFNILFIGTANLNNSMDEIKEFLKFNLIISETIPDDISSSKYSAIMIDENVLQDKSHLERLNKIENKVKILIRSLKTKIKFHCSDKFDLPISINGLNQKTVEIISSKKFNENSSISIKEYILDKNEKKLTKDNLFIIVTEKEIVLLELLFFKKTPMQKKDILKTVWKYSPDADTHTVETHIYRLRKKVFKKFNDDNIIINNKEGYKIWRGEIK